MLIRKISAILLLAFSFLILSCGDDKNSDDIKTEKVKTDDKVLSDIIIDEELGISYQVPLQWELMSSELTERYVARLDSEKFDGNFIVYQPKAFYFNSSISGLLRVGGIDKSKESEEKELSIQNYITLYQKFNSVQNIKQKKIQTDNLLVTQLIIEKSNLLSFKNIFVNKNKKIIQFDFSLQQKDYDKNKHAIEKSLASIKNL